MREVSLVKQDIKKKIKLICRLTKHLDQTLILISRVQEFSPLEPLSEFNEFKRCLKSHKNRFQLSAGLNLEKLNTILSKTTKIERRLKFNLPLKFFKFGLWLDNVG